MTAETVAKEMAENVTENVAETEIITVKMAETEKVVKSVENFRDFSGGYPPKKLKNMAQNGFKCTLNTTKIVLTLKLILIAYL